MQSQPSASPYPATFTFDPPERVANWRAIGNLVLAIPHFVIMNALQVVARAVGIVSWFAILFTGKLPEGFANIQSMYLRYELRVCTFALFMREEYPPFSFATTPADPGDDPRVRVDLEPRLTDRNRWTVAFRIILIIPHAIVFVLLAIAAAVVSLVAFFTVLFTGRWPEGMRSFVLSVNRRYLRLSAYFMMLNDVYPPFALD